MFKVSFYEKDSGESPVRNLLDSLRRQAATSKDARVHLNKITAYIDLLSEYGTWIGEPVTKHLEGEVWELRPLDNRILYFFAKGNAYILLHHFEKKTQQTPRREIEQAKREMKDYLERNA